MRPLLAAALALILLVPAAGARPESASNSELQARSRPGNAQMLGVRAPAGARNSELQALVPPFVARTLGVRARDLPSSWRRGCPVGPAELRLVRLAYWDFEGRRRVGELVVHRDVSARVVAVFRRLYRARFPIRRMVRVDRYGGSDRRSMGADNTSAFNCRFAQAAGPRRWSEHAYGRAIDVNPVENPYVQGSSVSPPAGRAYVDRTRPAPGMAVAGGLLVRAFATQGWSWGGRWRGTPDYQHFSTSGR